MVEGLLPYSQRYLGSLRNHFVTIGSIGSGGVGIEF